MTEAFVHEKRVTAGCGRLLAQRHVAAHTEVSLVAEANGPVDPVTGAVLGWLVGQAGTAGKTGLEKIVRGDKQQSALRKVVREAVEVATRDLADGAVLREALLVASPDAKQTEVVDVLDLDAALARQVQPTVETLVEQGYLFDAEALTGVLARHVMAGVQADAVRDGPLAPLAKMLHEERLATAGEQTVAELRRINVGIDRLSQASSQGPFAAHGLEGGGGVPGEAEHFTGRRGPLEELFRRVDAHDPAGSVAAVYVIDGMPGIGKTAFAIHAAHALAGRYHDGAIFVDLLGFTGPAPLSVSQALDELLAQAGVPRAQIPGEEGPKQALWRRLMRGRRALIVLDNARDAGQVEPLLPHSPRCLVLITARSKLYDLDAAPLPLPVLTSGEARSLFVAVAGADRCRNEAAVEQIVAGCHRLPLAIRLMASRVRHGDPINDVADDVAALPGEKKIRGVFDLSYASLDADLQEAVRLLGVYPGIDITGAVMAALADTSPAGGRRLLRGLATHNLIDRVTDQTGTYASDNRYQQHDLLRDYARSRAEADKPPAQRQAELDRLSAHYLAMLRAVRHLHDPPAASLSNTAGSVFEDLAHANAWMIAERANLLACLDSSPTASVDLAMTAGLLLKRLSYWTEAEHSYRLALTRCRATGDRSGEAAALSGLAEMDRMLDRYEAAQRRFEQAIAVFHEIGDRYGEAFALGAWADVDRRLGLYKAAQQRYEKSLAISQEIGDRFDEAHALSGLATIDLMLDRCAVAQPRYELAVAIFHEIGERDAEASALGGLGHAYLGLGRYEAAQHCFERSHAIRSEIGDRSGQASALSGLADVDVELGRHDAAQQRFEQAIATYQEIRDRSGHSHTLAGLAHLHQKLGQYKTAQQRYEQAITIFQEIGDRSGQASALSGLADVDVELGRHDAAQQRYEQAIATFQEIGNRSGEAHTLWGLGKLAQAKMDTDTAAERWREALQILDELQNPFAGTVRDALAALN